MSFADTGHPLANGVTGTCLTVPTRTPASYREAITAPDSAPVGVLGAQLFLPDGKGPWSVVTVVPGSLGVAPSHLAKADFLTDAGIAALVIDPFGRRGVESTVANQAQYSFAASAWDVLAATSFLAGRPEIDASRIGAQGHSRGGTAVLMAATMQHLVPVGGPPNAGRPNTGRPNLRGVYAAYPWSGHQFLRPHVGGTAVRSVIGDADEWCSPQQVQAHMHAIRLVGADATFRLVAGAQHSFDRDTPVELIEDAAIAPAAPTGYLDDEGTFVHPLADAPDPEVTERDLMVYGMKSGAGRRGARIGSGPGEAALFHADMMAFWARVLAA